MSSFITDVDNEKDVAIQNRELMEAGLNNIWGHSNLGLEAKKAAMAMLSTKNGMYARIPLTCKAATCPYADSCMLLKYDLAPAGESCPKETAEIELRYAAYNDDFDLDEASFTDKNIVSEIINYDIMLDRLKALLSKEEVLVVDIVAGISESGEEFTQPSVSKTWEAYERVEKRRSAAYETMLATRKSVKSNKDVTGEESLTQMMGRIMNAQDFVIDVKPEHIQ